MKYPEVLIIEDDTFTSKVLKQYFESKDIIVHQAFDIGSAFHKILNHTPDVIILDINLPSGNSLEYVEKMLSICNCPLIIYTSESSPDIEIRGLELNALDFIIKTRGVKVLYKRVSRLIDSRLKKRRKEQKTELEQTKTVASGIEIDITTKRVSYKGITHTFTKSEVHILYYLAVNLGKTVNRDELSFLIKGYAFDGWTRSLDLSIHRLRKKLASRFDNALSIETIRGVGYRMLPPNKDN